MTSLRGVVIRRGWEERLGRYRASGLTVARFCANEGVSVNTFYYWARRVGTGSPRTAPIRRNAASGHGREQTSRAHVASGTSNPAVVRFHFNAAVEVSVPAHCVDAIRCLAECIQQSRREHSDAFREVVVGPR
jgi:hypothetical protein